MDPLPEKPPVVPDKLIVIDLFQKSRVVAMVPTAIVAIGGICTGHLEITWQVMTGLMVVATIKECLRLRETITRRSIGLLHNGVWFFVFTNIVVAAIFIALRLLVPKPYVDDVRLWNWIFVGALSLVSIPTTIDLRIWRKRADEARRLRESQMPPKSQLPPA